MVCTMLGFTGVFRLGKYTRPYNTRVSHKKNNPDKTETVKIDLANLEINKPEIRVQKIRSRVPDDESIDMDKIVKDDVHRYKPNRELRNTLHARKVATEAERKLRQEKRLQIEKDRQIQIEHDMKEKEAKRIAIEKAKIEVLILKHRPNKPQTPDEVDLMGIGSNPNDKEGLDNVQPPYKKATKSNQIKSSKDKAAKSNQTKQDPLLGDPISKLKKNTKKPKVKNPTNKIDEDDICVYKFVFQGLPNPPDLEGVDEDRLMAIQRNVQEQLRKRDKERERNITKRVQEFKKTFNFVNSHLLKGVATMAELTKTDSRQPVGKVKPTDEMVMMPGLFDGTKPETSKQHYERFNLYINFQTKSGHFTGPVREAIDLFKHILDKTALVWFQTNRSKFKDLTTLQTMFLQRYNP